LFTKYSEKLIWISLTLTPLQFNCCDDVPALLKIFYTFSVCSIRVLPYVELCISFFVHAIITPKNTVNV